MATTKKSTTNPEKATLSVKTGKRKQLAMKWKKLCKPTCFLFSLSILEYIKK